MSPGPRPHHPLTPPAECFRTTLLQSAVHPASIIPGIRIKGIVLGLLCIFVVASTGARWGSATVVFLVSGVFGVVMLRYGDVLIDRGIFGGGGAGFNFLFAALTGMFGLGFVIETLFGNAARVPVQEQVPEVTVDEFLAACRASVAGVLGGIVTGVLPGLGSANAAALIEAVRGPFERESKEGPSSDQRAMDQGFIALTGAIQAADMFFAALVGYFAIGGVMRSGIAAAFGALQVPHGDMGYILVPAVACIGSALICAGLLFVFGQSLVNGFVRLAGFLDVRVISAGVFGFILGLLFLFTGWLGAIVCSVGLAIWFLTKWLQVRFSLMMGFFLVPVTVYAWVPHGSQKFPWLIRGWGDTAESSNALPLDMILTNMGWAFLLGIGSALILRMIIKSGRSQIA